jgi:hypothetical protein
MRKQVYDMNPMPTASVMNDIHHVVGQAYDDVPNSEYQINESGLREYLFSQMFPLGLAGLMIDNLKKLPIRYFICDDSSSMAEPDGQRVIGQGHSTKMIPCSRWSEMNEALRYVSICVCKYR